MEKRTYTKLSALVDDEFTINKVWGYQWKMYDPDSKRMLVSEKYEKGYRKIYGLDTNKGSLDVSSTQLGNMLESVQKNGQSDLNGVTFKVKSNGKTGMDIRYYLNPDFNKEREVQAEEPTVTDEDLNNLGW